MNHDDSRPVAEKLPKHITERRSIFPQFFTEREVSDAQLHALMAAANQAPNHKKTEPWRYRVYRKAGRDQLLNEIKTVFEAKNGADSWTEKLAKKFSKKLQQSPVVLAIFLHRDPQQSVPEWEEVAAVSCSVQNIWTSLADFGLGGYWSSPGFLCGDYGAFPGTPASYRCLGLFYLGHHEAPDLARPRGSWEEKVTVIE